MKFLIAFLAIFSFALALNQKAIEIVQKVNSNPYVSWKAAHNKFSNWNDEQLKSMLGTFIVPSKLGSKVAQKPFHLKDLPNEFDSRKVWPKCIHAIRNQEHCGSCWAFAGTEVLSDRFCIFSNGSVNVVLSPQDLVSCDRSDMGCNGGRLSSEWTYMKSSGVVSDDCLPYVSGGGEVPSCPSKCKDGKPMSSDKYYAKDYKHVGGWLSSHREEDIMEEIQKGGSVEAAFSVYRDFMSYKSGVYHHVSGDFLGGHAIKVVGWGIDSNSGLKYWIIANSWGTGWGMDGFFWMKKGSDECSIETQVYSGTPDLSRIPK